MCSGRTYRTRAGTESGAELGIGTHYAGPGLGSSTKDVGNTRQDVVSHPDRDGYDVLSDTRENASIPTL